MLKQIIFTFSLSLFMLFLLTPANTFAQQKEDLSKFPENYRKRIKEAYLFNVYIPKDFGEAFTELDRLIDKESKQKFKDIEEEEAVRKLHFSLGRWIIYNWGFYEGSRLSHYLRGFELYHPDDMARVIIRSYHRYINKVDLKLKDQIEVIKAEREALKKKDSDTLKVDSTKLMQKANN